jgi:nucleoside-diphosphate-sugar epimerase
LLGSEVAGAINVGTGEATEVRRFVGIAADAARMTERVDLGALEPGMDEAPVVRASIERLTTELGWRPRFTIETGIQDAVQRFRETLA